MFRPSKITGDRIIFLMRAKSGSRNSCHSVTTPAHRRPSAHRNLRGVGDLAAEDALRDLIARDRMPGSSRLSQQRFAIGIAGASRMSSVFGLTPAPDRDRLAFNEPPKCDAIFSPHAVLVLVDLSTA